MSSLVVYGTTGRHVSFTKQDLVLPTGLKEKHGEAAAHFITKQWPAVSTFWMNRVLKESKLQTLSIEEVIGKMEEELMHRFNKRKEEQQLHKKRKRLLENDDAEKGAGIPTCNVLLVNFVALRTYLLDRPQSDAVLEAVLDACAAAAGKDAIRFHRVLVDAEGAPPEQPEAAQGAAVCLGGDQAIAPAATAAGDSDTAQPPAVKGRRTDTDGSAPTEAPADSVPVQPELVFDDRVALVVTCTTPIGAASIIAKLHHRALDGRIVACRFIGD